MYKAPSIEKLARMMDLVKYVIFPDYSPIPSWTDGAEAIRDILNSQVAATTELRTDLTYRFISSLPEIARLLHTDVEAVLHNDPAVSDVG